jgi:alpha-L-glutamate ligase-like protein
LNIFKLFSKAKALRKKGILGMNQRNADFILPYNPRKFFPLVDNKLETKRLAQAAGIPVPTLYHTVEIEHQIQSLHEVLAQHKTFVIKPAQGSGGDGIIVINGRRGKHYLKSDGIIITQEDLSFHVSNILSGMYSLGGHQDKTIIEAKVEFDPIFSDISYQGVPDIRIVVFLGYPVMAMVRLPTRLSSGKANLHQGAIGVGIDLKTGITGLGTQQNRVVNEHPDTAVNVSGVQIPHWQDLLDFCARTYELSGLGYLGVVLVLDRVHGPMMLELNARPGLAIQIANQTGLLPRLNKVRAQQEIKRNAQERVSFALSHF